VLIGLAAGVAISAGIAGLTSLFDDEPSLTDQAREVIEANYFRDVDPDALQGSSVRAMVRELRHRYDDRFSHYFGPKALAAENAATSGEFSGVGLTVSQVKEGLRVADVLPNTPAEDAGIERGDEIVAVDGESIAGKPADISTTMIKGPPGSEVKLRVVPVDGGPSREISVERANVRVPAVDGRIVRVGLPEHQRKVAYVQFATFSEGAHGELRNEIERLYRRGAQALVLDLRGNGGGLLNEAVLSASIFIDDGVIVSTSSRTAGDDEYDAVGGALDPKPMVVMINRDTASAAEILSAALQDYGLATLVGTRTYGKNTVQEDLNLPEGALHLTIGEYVTSDGESLAGRGVQPDVKAKDDPKTPPDEGLQGGLDEVRSLLQGR
jgi:carboxyl-terminal processing protease